jgi:hypothetical protein
VVKPADRHTDFADIGNIGILQFDDNPIVERHFFQPAGKCTSSQVLAPRWHRAWHRENEMWRRTPPR